MKWVLTVSIKQGSWVLPNPSVFFFVCLFVFWTSSTLLNECPDYCYVKLFLKHLIEGELWLPFLESRAEFIHINERWVLQSTHFGRLHTPSFLFWFCRVGFPLWFKSGRVDIKLRSKVKKWKMLSFSEAKWHMFGSLFCNCCHVTTGKLSNLSVVPHQ